MCIPRMTHQLSMYDITRYLWKYFRNKASRSSLCTRPHSSFALSTTKRCTFWWEVSLLHHKDSKVGLPDCSAFAGFQVKYWVLHLFMTSDVCLLLDETNPAFAESAVLAKCMHDLLKFASMHSLQKIDPARISDSEALLPLRMDHIPVG